MNKNIALFRKKVELLLSQWGDNMVLLIAELKALGTSDKQIAEMMSDPKSTIGLKKTALKRKIKSESARLVNKIHIEGYLGEL